MTDFQVSVIVPIYNVETYLPACLESLDRQSKNIHFEIILINDGSADKSGLIADEFCSTRSWAKVIHQSNQGLSGARNTGIEIAKGEYVMFIDSDDYVDSNFIEIMHQSISASDVDILECSVNIVSEDGCWIGIKSSGYPYNTRISGIRKSFYYLFTSNTAWNKIYKRKIFIDNNIRYPRGVVNEDFATLPSLILCANSYMRISDSLYFYRSGRAGAITYRSEDKLSRNFPSVVEFIRKEIVRLKQTSFLSFLAILVQVFRTLHLRILATNDIDLRKKIADTYTAFSAEGLITSGSPIIIARAISKAIRTFLSIRYL